MPEDEHDELQERMMEVEMTSGPAANEADEPVMTSWSPTMGCDCSMEM